MSSQILLLDRVEFGLVKIEANSGEFSKSDAFPQLSTSFEHVSFLTRSDLFFPPDQAADPRVFVLTYGLKLGRAKGESKVELPYDLEIEAIGYFQYVGDTEFVGADRFRAVRLSGYQILYGAIREMVSNITARSRHGLLHLPARNFGAVALARSEEDEVERLKLLQPELAIEPAVSQPSRKRPSRAVTKQIKE